MRYRLSVITGLLMMLTIISPGRAEVRVNALVDRTRVAPGESLMLQVTIQEGGGTVEIGDIIDFKVISRGSSSNFQFVNGQMSREITYSYMLIPQRTGRLTIPALTVEVEGKPYLTQPITIEVTPRPAEGPAAAQADVWVTAEVSNATPVQGEQITYTFRFHRTVQTNEARFQAPDFKGYTAREVEDRHSFQTTVNGRQVSVTELYFVLTPLEAGRHTIEPAMIQVGVPVRDNKGRRSPMRDIFGRPHFRTRVLQTDAMEVNVDPLPQWQGRPPFSGLVGQFDLSATMEATDLKVGDSATLALTLKGRGNLMDAQAPVLELPAALKHYADNPEEHIQLDPEGYSGKKVFRTALVPVETGEIQIDPIRLVYFNTGDKQFRTLTAIAPVLHISPADPTADAQVAVTPDPLALAKKRVAFTGRDILPPKESLEAIRSQAPISGWLFILAVIAPAAVYAGAAFVQRYRHQEQTPTARMKAKARQALKLAGCHSGDQRLGHLYQALTAAILASAGRTGAALTWKEAETMLLKTGRPEEQARQVAELLSTIESCKFGAAEVDDVEQARLMDQTRKLMRELI